MLALPAVAEEAIPGRPLLSGAADEHAVVTLPGNVRPEARVAENDKGLVDDAMRVEHVHLQLKRSPAQERVVEEFVNSLTDRSSPNYHHWLTADEFGRRFGVAQADITKVSGWLGSNGLKVDYVYPSRMVVDFSGTAGQISRAFAAPLHRLTVDGAAHIGNVSDPRIPAALAPVVEGIVSLHDFRAHNRIARRPLAIRRPDDTGDCGGVTCYDLTPGDLATIYDLNDLYANNITGAGEIVAAVEDTNLFSNNDWTSFRKIFGLTKYTTGALKVVHPAPKSGRACANPTVTDNDGEATLDVEWASAAAPGATIMLASCKGTATTDGVYLATQNLVNSVSPPPVISVSYGICEADNGAAENKAFNSLYQQAAAMGISVFVATGDNGPTDCAGSTNGTTYGIGVNGWGATQYNVAVGGTDFRDTFDGTNATYWKANAGAPWATAKSYIPEIPWNDTCANAMIAQAYGPPTATYGAGSFCNSAAGANFRSLGGGEGGPSGCYSGAASVDNVVSGTCKGYPKPSWQKGLVGIPADGVRDVPDISLFASDGSAWNHNYATCFTDPNGGGSCGGNPVTWTANAGGTSYATPIMAAIQVLVDQYMGSTQGNPAPVYYQLAASANGGSNKPACAADKGKSIGVGCIFHDVVSGDDIVNCKGPYNCYRPGGTYGVLSTSSSAYKPAFKAAAGYDLATGIGSVDGYNLVANWPTPAVSKVLHRQ
jgi:subtilase family serine protease